MVRLKDVAARAGVSIMTVSKVLRDAPDISTATKTRVRLLAKQMGYVPDSMAQGLRTRTTKIFGVVISSSTNPIFSRTLLALEERTFDLGYDLMLGHTLGLIEREETLIRRFLARRVDGLFISPVYRFSPTAPVYEELHRRGVPTVLLGPRAPFCQQFVNVETDDGTASYAAAKHLLQLGHKRIALFSGPAVAPWAQERAEGYRRALREAQLEVEDKLIFQSGTGIEDGEKTALQMLNEGAYATAIHAANDMVAIGAARVLLRQGLKVPQDISIVGFGNTLVSELFEVPLTTVRQPKFRLGTAAVDLMHRLLRGERPPAKRLGAELVIRSSTAPPPSRK